MVSVQLPTRAARGAPANRAARRSTADASLPQGTTVTRYVTDVGQPLLGCSRSLCETLVIDTIVDDLNRPDGTRSLTWVAATDNNTNTTTSDTTDVVATDDVLAAELQSAFFLHQQETLDGLQLLVSSLSPDPTRAGSIDPADIPVALEGYARRITKLLKTTHTSRFPPKISLSPEWSSAWKLQSVRLQISYIHILYAIITRVQLFDNTVFDPTIIADFFDFLLVKMDLGRSQNFTFQDDNTSEISSMIRNLTGLCTLFLIECLGLSNFASYSTSSATNSSVLQSPIACKRIHDILVSRVKDAVILGDVDPLGPVFIAWGVFLDNSWNELTKEYGDDSRGIPVEVPSTIKETYSFVSSAVKSSQLLIQSGYLSLRSVDYLLTLVKGANFSSSPRASTYKNTIRCLLLLFFETINDVSQLPMTGNLSKLFSLIMKDEPTMSQSWWDFDFRIQHRRCLLEMVSKTFPLDTRPFLEFLTCSMNSDADAIHVFDLMSQLRTFADIYSSSEYDGNPFEHSSEFKKYEWKGANLLPLSTRFPYGPQPGAFVVEVGIQDPRVVLHNWNYSGWYLIMGILDSFLNANVSALSSWNFEMGNGVFVGPMFKSMDSGFGGYQFDNRIIPTVSQLTDVLDLLQRFFLFADGQLLDSFIVHLAQFDGPGIAWKKSPDTIFIEMLFHILACLCYSEDISLTAISTCLKCISNLLPVFPIAVWNGMSDCFIAQTASSSGKIIFKTTVLDKRVFPMEQELGTYAVTHAYLELIVKLIRASQIDHRTTPHFNVYEQELERLYKSSLQDYTLKDSFTSVIGDENAKARFIERVNIRMRSQEMEVTHSRILRFATEHAMTKIFPKCDSWRFRKVRDKYQMHVTVLTIIDRILSDTTWTNNVDSPYHELREMLVKLLLSSRTDYFIRPLVRCMTVGVNLPRKLYSMSKFTEARCTEDSISLSLKIAGLLLECRMKEDIDKLCVFEDILLDNSFRPFGVSHNLETIQIIGRYVAYFSDVNIQLNAVNLVTVICALAPKWPRPPSLAGYFGSDAFEFVSNSIELIKPENDTLPTQLRVATIDMITLIVATQAGLSNMFLIGNGGVIEQSSLTESNGDKLVLSASSLINVLSNFLKEWKVSLDKSPRVFSAIIKLLDALWQNAPRYMGILDQLRKNKSFWEYFISIFKEVTNNIYSAPVGNDTNDMMDTSAESISLVCYWRVLKTYMLRIMSYEMYFTATKHQSELALATAAKILDTVDFKREFELTPPVTDVPVSALADEFDAVFASMQLHGSLKSYMRDIWSVDFDVRLDFGHSYIYDFDLFVQHIFGNVSDLEALQQSDNTDVQRLCALSQQLVLINECHSFSDAQSALLKGWKTFLSITVTRVPNASYPGMKGIMPMRLVELFKGLTMAMENISELSPAACIYRHMGSELISLLIAYATGVVSSSNIIQCSCPNPSRCVCTSKTKQQVAPLNKEFMEAKHSLWQSILPIVTCMSTDHYSLGPNGYISEFGFHIELFMAALLSCQFAKSIYKPDSVERLKAAENVCASWIDHVCKALNFLLRGVSYSADGSRLVVSALEREFKGVDILLSTLSEIILLHDDLNDSVWISTLRNYNIIPSLLKLFSAYIFDLKCASPDIACRLLSAFKVLSSHTVSCEIMVEEGVFAMLCGNSFSAVVATTGVGTLQHAAERDPWSKVWLSMLGLVSKISLTLGGNLNVIRQVVGFVRMYHSQINRTLDFNAQWMLTQPRLEETVAITEILYSIIFYYGDGMVSAEFARFLESADVGSRRKFEEIFKVSSPQLLPLISQGKIGLAKGRGSESELWNVMKPGDRRLISYYVSVIFNLLSHFIRLRDTPNLMLRRIVCLPRENSVTGSQSLSDSLSRPVFLSAIERLSNPDGLNDTADLNQRRHSLLDSPTSTQMAGYFTSHVSTSAKGNVSSGASASPTAMMAPTPLYGTASVSSQTILSGPLVTHKQLISRLGSPLNNPVLGHVANTSRSDQVPIYYFRKTNSQDDSTTQSKSPEKTKENQPGSQALSAEQATNIKFCIALATRNSVELIKRVIEA